MIDQRTNAEPLPWTGERYLPDVHGNIELEHVHRYLLAGRYVFGKRVLDIACGEGYGSALLAQTAMSVVGVDISTEAIGHANAKYRSKNLVFEAGSCAAIPLPDHCIDVVVSFETIEHHDEHDAMMREIKRVLVHGGMLVISSPDKFEYSDRPAYANPYHVRELYRGEFKSLLKTHFKFHRILGQRIVYGSAIFDEGEAGHISSFSVNDKVLLPAPGIKHPLYLVALASDHELPISESGLLEQPVEESDYVKDTIKQITALLTTVSERDGRIAERDGRIADRDGRIADLERILIDRDERIVVLEHSVTRIDQEIVDRDRRISHFETQVGELSRTIKERDKRITQLNSELAGHVDRGCQFVNTIADRDDRLAHLGKEIALREAQIDFQAQSLQALLRSRSWRWTRVLRLVASYLRRKVRPSSGNFERNATIFPSDTDDSINRIERSPLFDQAFYARENPDVVEAGIKPAAHYFLTGWKEFRNPSRDFSSLGYLQDNPDVAAAGINPLLHYIDSGHSEGRQIVPVRMNSGAEATDSVTKTAQALTDAAFRDIDRPSSPTPNARHEPIVDRIDAEIQAIDKSGMFNTAYYLVMNPDIDPNTTNPLRHYCERGWREGRNPSNDFDSRGYLDAYSDIKQAGINPLWHFVVAGSLEGRQASFESKSSFEDDAFFGHSGSDIGLVAYYTETDWHRVKHAHNASGGQRPLPHEDIGLYAHVDAVTLRKQATMAKRHGLIGWCYSLHASQRQGENAPLSRLMENLDIEIGFCIDVELSYDATDMFRIAFLEAAFGDDRYLKVDGRPLLVITLPEGAERRAAVFKDFDKQFIANRTIRPYLIVRLDKPEYHSPSLTAISPIDAFLNFPVDPVPSEVGSSKRFNKSGVDTVPYSAVVSQGIAGMGMPAAVGTHIYQVVTIGRDDSPIDSATPLRYGRFHLKDYRRWLDAAIADTRAKHRADRRFLFVNAWNDWNHGAMLEPDRIGGYNKLNETSRALLGMPSGRALPKVSVIVPNYNHARYLPRRLESIYRQTYRNIEVLLLDDCSTDQSRGILEEYFDRYRDRTQILFNLQNSGGVFRQWSKGIKAASGDLIWIAESDDYCDENFLEELVQSFEDEAVMLACSKVDFVRSDESVMPSEFSHHVRDLACKEKWNKSYVNSAHQEVREALGIINTIPNASAAIFRRPMDMPLLEDEKWLSMAVVGDWLFYLNLIRGGKIAYSRKTTSYFRRYQESTAASTYHKEAFYRELGIAARTVQQLYDVPESVMTASRRRSKELYDHFCNGDHGEFDRWFDEGAVREARSARTPNILLSTMAFYPGGAEILPIRMANELKRAGYCVTLLSVGLTEREDGVRRMLRRDVPVVETSDVEQTRDLIREFGIEVLNSHQWHVQKYPTIVADVFHALKAHVASLHGMIEHGHAFGVTNEQLKIAHENVTTWVYTAEKNLKPFIEHGLYTNDSPRFIKLPNGMEPPKIKSISRRELEITDGAFVLCCVSRAIADKGWAEAIDAVGIARELCDKDIQLILVGNGPVYEEYRRVGVPEFVHLIGFSENSVGYYSMADMGIMLTKFPSESFPLTIVDCLFAGRPYISCNVGDILNMLSDAEEVAGEVVSLNDWQVPVRDVAELIAAYSTDSTRYSKACAVIPRLVNRYRIDRVAEKYVVVFREALARH